MISRYFAVAALIAAFFTTTGVLAQTEKPQIKPMQQKPQLAPDDFELTLPGQDFDPSTFRLPEPEEDPEQLYRGNFDFVRGNVQGFFVNTSGEFFARIAAVDGVRAVSICDWETGAVQENITQTVQYDILYEAYRAQTAVGIMYMPYSRKELEDGQEVYKSVRSCIMSIGMLS